MRDSAGKPTELLSRFLGPDYIGTSPRDLVRRGKIYGVCFFFFYKKVCFEKVEAFLETLRPQFDDWKRAAPTDVKVKGEFFLLVFEILKT